ncbi:MAG: Pseudouridine synthase [Microgenomates group bacterium GW2011_GWA1_Microgenomates_45_10]|nr:MAG: Pseudouridine synthase [Microgenomates group bacterium GW2011_GWA1_Microgenomates_45_10]
MIEPEVVFEDESVLVLNKPAGWVVNRVDSTDAPLVADWVDEHLGLVHSSTEMQQGKDAFFARSGIVHRLDKETSGLLLTAKTVDAFGSLTSQFKERQIKKSYQALVHGKVESSGKVEIPVGRLPWNRERFGVLPQGKKAATSYTVAGYHVLSETVKQKLIKLVKKNYRNQNEIYTLLDLQPETGRTHQIRVHLKSLNHPIVADDFYAGRKTARIDRLWCPRLFLHAGYLGFVHPVSNKWVEFTLTLPADLVEVLAKLIRL